MSDLRTDIRTWLASPLPADVRAALDRLAREPDVARIAVMPDVHLSHDVSVGTVLATTHRLYPSAVGGDIGCGMSALAFDAGADLLAGESAAAKLFAALYERVPSNRHRAPRDLPPPLTDAPLSHPRLESARRRDARVQLGTLGRGNHFLEFQRDQADERLWLMLHTGSRGIGQLIRDHHLSLARALHPTSALPSLDATTPQGQAYLADMSWALEYAAASRAAIRSAVIDILKSLFDVESLPASLIDCHHNFVRQETIDGQSLWIHRKGALPAAEGEPGVIPGSMGSASFHVQGRGHAPALCSSSHGAGRALSRDQARRRISPRDLHRQMANVWFDHRRAPRLCDEAPTAYKDIHAVMRAQRDLTKVTRTLHPVLSYKGT